MRHEFIIGVERRRHWHDEEKQAILSEVGVNGVRRQSFWVQRRPKLRKCLAHLVGLIMRPAGGDASVALRVSFV